MYANENNMISEKTFQEKFEQMARLCGFPLTKATYKPFYIKLQYQNEVNLFKAFELMAEDPPMKLNLKHIRSFISIANKESGEVAGKWNGKECTDPECDQGLIPININGNKTSMRCTKCKSYAMPSMMWYTPENMDWLRNRYKEIDERKDGKIIFLNKHSFQV